MASSADPAKDIADRLSKAEKTIAKLTAIIDGESAAAKDDTPSIAIVGGMNVVFDGTYDSMFQLNEKYRVPVQASPIDVDLYKLSDFHGPVVMNLIGECTKILIDPMVDGPLTPKDQGTYNIEFYKKFRYMKSFMDKNISNIVIAGGAAAYPFHQCEDGFHDVDIFIVGIDPDDIKALNAKVEEVHGAIIASLDRNLTIKVSKGLIKYRSGRGGPEIQVILRAYSSISSLLHGFDVPASCVAFDGRNTYMTTLGLYAQMYHSDIVYPKYRSPTFEKRLMKYLHYGYSIILPGFTGGRGEWTFKHMSMKVCGTSTPNVFHLEDYHIYPRDESDYDVPELSWSPSFVHKIIVSNYHSLHGIKYFTNVKYIPNISVYLSTDEDGEEHAIDKLATYCFHRSVISGNVLNIGFLRMLLTDSGAIEFTKLVMDRHIDAARMMLRGAATIIYKNHKFKPEDMWFRLKSDTAYTASCNPLPETYDEWYSCPKP